MSSEKILVTGASGCIGSWVLRHLTDEGVDFIASDLIENPERPKLLLSQAELDAIKWMKLDVIDGAAVNAAVADNGITHIVHLAGLQVPFAKANPPLGAQVNVVGTVNLLEAKRHNDVQGLSYASSMAVFGPKELYPITPIPDDAQTAPETLYGVYKVANEHSARIFWQDWQVGSVGLRPGSVYGIGRDQGVTSDVAKAILAIAADRPFKIRFDGLICVQHASDVARMFIECARANHQGAAVCNLRNDVIDVAEVVKLMTELYPDHKITHATDAPLPIAADFEDARMRSIIGEVPHIPLAAAIQQDVAAYRALIARDAIDLTQLDR